MVICSLSSLSRCILTRFANSKIRSSKSISPLFFKKNRLLSFLGATPLMISSRPHAGTWGGKYHVFCLLGRRGACTRSFSDPQCRTGCHIFFWGIAKFVSSLNELQRIPFVIDESPNNPGDTTGDELKYADQKGHLQIAPEQCGEEAEEKCRPAEAEESFLDDSRLGVFHHHYLCHFPPPYMLIVYDCFSFPWPSLLSFFLLVDSKLFGVKGLMSGISSTA